MKHCLMGSLHPQNTNRKEKNVSSVPCGFRVFASVIKSQATISSVKTTLKRGQQYFSFVKLEVGAPLKASKYAIQAAKRQIKQSWWTRS